MNKSTPNNPQIPGRLARLLSAALLSTVLCVVHCTDVSEPNQNGIPPACTVVPITDLRDGQTYKTVTVMIYNQKTTWMAENLRYAGEDGELGVAVVCPERLGNCDIYGRLYTWDEVNKRTRSCGASEERCQEQLCPSGWHVPSMTEWKQLIAGAGGEEIAGKRLRASDGWMHYGSVIEDPDPLRGTDDYCFSALPAGKDPVMQKWSCPQPECEEPPPPAICPPPILCAPPYPDGEFGESGWWWSRTEMDDDDEKAFSVSIHMVLGIGGGGDIRGKGYEKSYSMSVRCVKNWEGTPLGASRGL